MCAVVRWSIVLTLGRDGGAGVQESAEADVEVCFGSNLSGATPSPDFPCALCLWISVADGATSSKLRIATKKMMTNTTSKTTNPKPPPCFLMPEIWVRLRERASGRQKPRRCVIFPE